MANYCIRERAKNHDIKLWELADKLGISDTTLSKMLRKELPHDKKDKVLLALKEMIEERDF